MFASLFGVFFGLSCVCKDSSQSTLGPPLLFGPSVVLMGEVAEFTCELPTHPKNESILLQLYREDDRNKLLGEYTSLDGEVAVFPTVIQPHHKGNLECVAKAQNNSNMQPTVSKVLHLKVVEPVTGAEIDVVSGRSELFEGDSLEVRCIVSAGDPVSFKWLRNGGHIHHGALGNHLMIDRMTSEDGGSYMCVATNHFNETQVYTSNSSEVVITVKDVVSNPDISFTVVKDDSHNYFAMVTCQSSSGTPPVTFSLYNGTQLVANTTVEEGNAIFKVTLVLDTHMGWLQCQADNGYRVAYSPWIPLEVVSVGGPVRLHYDHDVGENYAVIGLRFYCQATKGSHPRYQWFLNKTRLHDRGIFYYIVHQPPERSILQLSVGKSIAGTYNCEVSDSFDNSTTITSRRWYLDREAVNRLPVPVVAAVFGCFTVLVLLVFIWCGLGVLLRRRTYVEETPLEMEAMVAACEGEMDWSDFSEDEEVVKAARAAELDQTSAASVED
ncbi:platelet endothelial cell adhesion molecule [Antennarius striatus]|uniref:platelet endothelial cell adhesion molecule n=1 Tax=Antennarius striatus TaxID=241820 RepID=UPI0035B41ED3